MKEKIIEIYNGPIKGVARDLLTIIVSLIIFYIGSFEYVKNPVVLGIWERDFSDMWHALTGFGHTKSLTQSVPKGAVSFVTFFIVILAFLKQVFRYPSNLSLSLLLLVIADFLAISTVVKVFVFAGEMTELLYYFLSFSAGAYLFGGKQISQLTLLLIGFLVLLVRIVLADTTYFYEYWIPIAFLSYFVLRLPFNSENFRAHLKDYNISNIIGRSQ